MELWQTARAALGLLNPRDRRLLVLSTLAQMATSVLDLVGVLLLGLVAALALATVQSQPTPSFVSQIAGELGLGAVSDQQLVAALAAIAALVLILKSIISALLTRRILLFLSNRQALVSARLTKALLSRPLSFVQSRSSQATAYALIAGSAAATVVVLGQLVVVATEVTLLVALGVTLLVVSPVTALWSIAFFLAVAIILQKAMGGWARRVGAQAAQADIDSLNAVQESLAAYREISVSDRRSMYAMRIEAIRWKAAKVTADAQFIGLVPKYSFEVALVLGGLGLTGFLFAAENSVVAFGTLALFLAASTRVMPSLLRLQTATLTLRGAAGAASPTFELARDLGDLTEAPQEARALTEIRQLPVSGYPGFIPTVELSDVTVQYPDADRPALSHFSLRVKAGQSVALVGLSGAGKSTAVDAVLGILTPDLGRVRLSGMEPRDAIRRWPGAVSYVPQDIALANGSVRENVALGLPPEAIDDELVWDALDRAHLATFLRDNREGLDTHIGEGGVRLSGGQRQRLGIARALYSRPRLIVLDEATSALDAQTESAVTQMVTEMAGEVTSIVVAHRLSTVRSADMIVYLSHGSIESMGSFDQVREAVPDFGRQAELMGLA